LGLKDYLDQNVSTNDIIEQKKKKIKKINQDNAVTLSVMLNNIEEKVSRLITDTDSPLHDLLKDRKVLFE